jgi:L-galactono-1,4-lactone dehydrogenase
VSEIESLERERGRVGVSVDFAFHGLIDLLITMYLQHIREVNQAEASFWKNSQTTRQADSVDVLGFDCGGEQWVLEVCIPLGHLHEENKTDLHFVRDLLAVIEEEEVPAASPIEQR